LLQLCPPWASDSSAELAGSDFLSSFQFITSVFNFPASGDKMELQEKKAECNRLIQNIHKCLCVKMGRIMSLSKADKNDFVSILTVVKHKFSFIEGQFTELKKEDVETCLKVRHMIAHQSNVGAGMLDNGINALTRCQLAFGIKSPVVPLRVMACKECRQVLTRTAQPTVEFADTAGCRHSVTRAADVQVYMVANDTSTDCIVSRENTWYPGWVCSDNYCAGCLRKGVLTIIGLRFDWAPEDRLDLSVSKVRYQKERQAMVVVEKDGTIRDLTHVVSDGIIRRHNYVFFERCVVECDDAGNPKIAVVDADSSEKEKGKGKGRRLVSIDMDSDEKDEREGRGRQGKAGQGRAVQQREVRAPAPSYPKQSSVLATLASPKAAAPAPAPAAAAPAPKQPTGGFKMSFQNSAAFIPSTELQFGDLPAAEKTQPNTCQTQEQVPGHTATTSEAQAQFNGDCASLNCTLMHEHTGGPRDQQTNPATQQHMPHHQMGPYGFWNSHMMYPMGSGSMLGHMGMQMPMGMPFAYPQGYGPQHSMYGQQPLNSVYSIHGENQSHSAQSTHGDAHHQGIAPSHLYHQQLLLQQQQQQPAADGQEGSLHATQQGR